ncbi:somatostatin receptor type 1-like [Ptychodera flava]|uniref:somatostatin receptor type 1-like n=1 Tax=Ptychodera flava TaxID=63121 RepID=UPI00396A6289
MKEYEIPVPTSNWSGTKSPEDYSSSLPPWMFIWFMPTLSAIICFVGLIGSGIVIFVGLRFPNMKSVTNTFILNLASADFIFFLILPFIIYFNIDDNWVFGLVVCKLTMGIDAMNMFTGIFTLTAMAVDRYWVTVHAGHARNKRTILKARGICLILWILSSCVSVPLWLFATIEQRNGDKLCSILCSEETGTSFILYAFTVAFVLPVVIITMCYAAILLSLIKRRDPRRCRSGIKVGRVASLVLIAVVIFMICWLPFWVVRLWHLFHRPNAASEMVYYCSLFLTYINSCLNPLIYACFKEDFKRNMSTVILSLRPKRLSRRKEP